MLPDSSIAAPVRRRARLFTAAAFFLDGFIFACWVARIPAVQERLQLRNGTLGFALLMVSLGALVTMPILGRLVVARGSRLLTALAVGFFAATLVLPGIATGVVSLSIALFLFGAGYGAVNVTANAQAVTVERHYHRPIMGSFHACYSLGGIVGAALGSLAAAAHLSPPTHFTLVTIAVLAVTPLLARFLIPDADPAAHRAAAGDDAPRTRSSALILLGLIAFCAMLGEGAMADWTAAFLRQVSQANASVAAFGFAAFSLTMTLGRLAADRTTLALGPVRQVRLGGTLAAVGVAVAVLFPAAPTAIVGFALVGAGLSSLVPTLFSAAGRTPGVAPSVAIATVSTTGYFGFLCGPPLIGFASEAVTLRYALALVSAAAILVFALARRVDVHSRTASAPTTPRTPSPEHRTPMRGSPAFSQAPPQSSVTESPSARS